MTRPELCINGEAHDDVRICQVQQKVDAEPTWQLVDCGVCKRLDVMEDGPLSALVQELLDLVDMTGDTTDEQVENSLERLSERIDEEPRVVGVYTGKDAPDEGFQPIRCTRCGHVGRVANVSVDERVSRDVDGIPLAVCRGCVHKATPDMEQPPPVRRLSRRTRLRHRRLAALVAYLRGNGEVSARPMMDHLRTGTHLHALLVELETAGVVVSRRVRPGELAPASLPRTVYRLVQR
jgi:hypothetical protein